MTPTPQSTGPVADRFRAAGIPVPPPLTPAEQMWWEETMRQVDAETAQFWADHKVGRSTGARIVGTLKPPPEAR